LGFLIVGSQGWPDFRDTSDFVYQPIMSFAIEPSESFFHFRTMVDGIEAEVHRSHAYQCFSAFSEMFGCSLSDLPKPVFYLFDTHTSFKDHLRRVGKEVAPLAQFSGMFWNEPDGPALGTFVRNQPRLSRFKTLQHEVFHFFETMTFGSTMPSWLSEGEAQYYEDAIFVDGGMLTGWIPPEKFESLQILTRCHSRNSFFRLKRTLMIGRVSIPDNRIAFTVNRGR
jgi:hypothetical protein